jgi:hypothetical protein
MVYLILCGGGGVFSERFLEGVAERLEECADCPICMEAGPSYCAVLWTILLIFSGLDLNWMVSLVSLIISVANLGATFYQVHVNLIFRL